MGDRLKGKVAVVTGAGRGIGRAESLLLAEEGASPQTDSASGQARTVVRSMVRSPPVLYDRGLFGVDSECDRLKDDRP